MRDDNLWAYALAIVGVVAVMVLTSRCSTAPASEWRVVVHFEEGCDIDFSEHVEEWQAVDAAERLQVAGVVGRGHPNDCAWFDPRPECKE